MKWQDVYQLYIIEALGMKMATATASNISQTEDRRDDNTCESTQAERIMNILVGHWWSHRQGDWYQCIAETSEMQASKKPYSRYILGLVGAAHVSNSLQVMHGTYLYNRRCHARSRQYLHNPSIEHVIFISTSEIHLSGWPCTIRWEHISWKWGEGESLIWDNYSE